MPKLIINPGTPQTREFELKQGNNYVGRAFANDLKIEDGSVSGSHAVIVVTGHLVVIRDLGSTNGTKINQLPATESPLQSGQILRLGAVELLFMADTALPNHPPMPLSPAAAQISTDFVIREPSHVGVASPSAPAASQTTAPAPVPHGGQQLSIPKSPPAPTPVSAPAPMPYGSQQISIPKAAPASTAPPPPPAPIIATSAPAPAPVTIPPRPRAAPVVELPAPIPVRSAPPTPIEPKPAPIAAPVSEAKPTAPLPVAPLEAPLGMTMCKFHKNNPGQWFCPKCQLLFCSLCVSTLPTPQGAKQFCRSCGTQCALVKMKFDSKQEKSLKKYSDMTILLRSVGFGAIAAIVGGGIWIGFTALTTFDLPPIFAPVIGVMCGFSVQRACQDRPGVAFSLIAVFTTLLGVTIGKIGAIVLMHGFIFNVTSLAMAIFGLLLGLFLAWKFGGGDF